MLRTHRVARVARRPVHAFRRKVDTQRDSVARCEPQSEQDAWAVATTLLAAVNALAGFRDDSPDAKEAGTTDTYLETSAP